VASWHDAGPLDRERISRFGSPGPLTPGRCRSRSMTGHAVYGRSSTLAVKIFGHDLETSTDGQESSACWRRFPERECVRRAVTGGRISTSGRTSNTLARFGLTTGDAQEVIGIGWRGRVHDYSGGAGTLFLGSAVRAGLSRQPGCLGRLLIGRGDGPQVPLAQVAHRVQRGR